ncbi:hypothetical protein BWK59_06370 [Flavobacterium davisii]|uniref:Uncharacterized protein n=1 Tax=Flavobacterium davisii TaxID=2906077 RepID=A0A246GJC7_9FLAO|nr:hypothetical protein [Flavobacterium davisii]OWP84212.1 hypothetical protein BWK59_06370 [Flavobacterium davisii]
MIKNIALRYDLIEAYNAGIKIHPQLQMKELGYTVLDFEGVPIADCAIIKVERIITPLPKYLTIVKTN